MEKVHLAHPLEVVEIEPIMKSLHRPVLLLTEENVLEPAGTLDPLTPAVHREPELGQKVLKLSLGLGEQSVGLEEVKGLLHHLGLHHLVEQGLLLALLLPCSVLSDAYVRLIILVKLHQAAESRLSKDSRIPDEMTLQEGRTREDQMGISGRTL